MNRSRSELRKDALEDFRTFCEKSGWRVQECKGDYEVLRMRHPEIKEPLIVHKRLKTVCGNIPRYLTTWGQSQRMATEYIKRRSQNGQHAKRLEDENAALKHEVQKLSEYRDKYLAALEENAVLKEEIDMRNELEGK